jgi:hypothetical protein
MVLIIKLKRIYINIYKSNTDLLLKYHTHTLTQYLYLQFKIFFVFFINIFYVLFIFRIFFTNNYKQNQDLEYLIITLKIIIKI